MCEVVQFREEFQQEYIEYMTYHNTSEQGLFNKDKFVNLSISKTARQNSTLRVFDREELSNLDVYFLAIWVALIVISPMFRSWFNYDEYESVIFYETAIIVEEDGQRYYIVGGADNLIFIPLS
tara:strand:+ start:670 stop:1038 length:369 start_codon:yes stop_codon:yes gene_type:complete